MKTSSTDKSLKKNVLCIFAKYPELGKVKTRLAKDIGNKGALEIYKSLLSDIVSEHKNNDYDLYIAFTPKEKENDFKKVLGNLNYLPQHGNSLGKRMLNAFEFLLTKYSKAVIIGSDIPNLTKKTIDNSFNLLDKKDIVIGPSFDGGYYLIGMKQTYDVFSDIEWSVDSVLIKTLEILKDKNISFSLIEKKQDIDTAQDLLLFGTQFKTKSFI